MILSFCTLANSMVSREILQM